MDYFFGRVFNVIDGDTFDIEIDRVSINNEFSYDRIERVRIFGEDAPELNTLMGMLAKNVLEQRFLFKNVQIIAHARDSYGRIVGEVKTI